MGRRALSLLALAALPWLVGGSARAEPQPAAGGERLVAALETAPLAVVGELGTPVALDDEAWTAELRVTRALRGEAPDRAQRGEAGRTLRIAWEERARSRPVRFGAGDRVLLALEPLPGHSIWRRRIPDPARRRGTLAIAERGGAFLRAPGLGAVGLLEHYLALPPEARVRNRGVGYLVQLLAAEPPMARAALERLAAVPELDAALDPTSARRWVAALVRSDSAGPERDAPERTALLGLVGERSLESLRPALVELADAGALAPAVVFEALGRLDGALPAERARALLARDDSAAHRAAGARYAPEALADALPPLVRRDPAPRVRAAAISRWIGLRGVDGVDRAVFALDDADEEVRRAALVALGKLGPTAVPVLRGYVDDGAPHVARAAVGALAVAGGQAGYRALAEIAETHPDPGVRLLARTALGRPIGETHGE